MKTLLLQPLQQPTRVDKLLHEVVESAGLVLTEAGPIHDRNRLPLVLRRIIALATNVGQSWAAWENDRGRVWLFVAEMPLSLSREPGAPVLQVDQYTEGGEMKETGRWTVSDGKWQRCAD